MWVYFLGLCPPRSLHSVLELSEALWGARQVHMVGEEGILTYLGSFSSLFIKGCLAGQANQREEGYLFVLCVWCVPSPVGQMSQALCCLLQRQEIPDPCPWEAHSSDGHCAQRITHILVKSYALSA